jgi:hypothetical protein
MSANRLSGKRLEKELEAQKLRAKALSHLETIGEKVGKPGQLRAKVQTDNTLEQMKKSQSVSTDASKILLLKQQSELRERSLHMLSSSHTSERVQSLQINHRNDSAQKASEVLPAGWTELIHEATRQKFYFHSVTKETRHERPGDRPEQPKAVVTESEPINQIQFSLKRKADGFASIDKRRFKEIDPLDPTGGVSHAANNSYMKKIASLTMRLG